MLCYNVKIEPTQGNFIVAFHNGYCRELLCGEMTDVRIWEYEQIKAGLRFRYLNLPEFMEPFIQVLDCKVQTKGGFMIIEGDTKSVLLAIKLAIFAERFYCRTYRTELISLQEIMLYILRSRDAAEILTLFYSLREVKQEIRFMYGMIHEPLVLKNRLFMRTKSLLSEYENEEADNLFEDCFEYEVIENQIIKEYGNGYAEEIEPQYKPRVYCADLHNTHVRGADLKHVCQKVKEIVEPKEFYEGNLLKYLKLPFFMVEGNLIKVSLQVLEPGDFTGVFQ